MTEERIVAYLLEELPEEELERFDDECFAQESWPAEINLVEEDLIDDYLRGVLTPEQRLRFERNYLTTAARMERVRKAAALLRHANECQPIALTALTPPTEQPWIGRFRAFWYSRTWAPRIAMALVAVAVVAIVWSLSGQRTFSPRNVTELTLNVSNSDRAVGNQPGTVPLTRDTDALKISLTLPDPLAQAVSYRVHLIDDSGGVKTAEIVMQDPRSVTVMIPAAQLNRGKYALKLFALRTDRTEQLVGNYFFIVV